MPTLILASGSQRRADILRRMRIPFVSAPQDVDESFSGIHPAREAVRLAGSKLTSLLEGWEDDSPWALAADTFIILERETLGKPADRDDACRILRKLSGRKHEVITGLALHSPGMGITTSSVVTGVYFGALSEAEIEWYLDTEEWLGAAGAYRIQERGAVLVERIDGSYSNVMGLPIRDFYGMLRQHNYPFRP